LVPAAFTSLYFRENSQSDARLDAGLKAVLERFPGVVTPVVVGTRAHAAAPVSLADSAASSRLDLTQGDWILVRPDGYIHAHLKAPSAAQVEQAFLQALGHTVTSKE
jgi:hypothetical protein